ncbi:MAG: NUDIX domain-containing protein [Candidatus Micrarchaeota archaeon]|nr:NUDIX domain-containing protein [Candidatus Micrarchaeota archaeon]
MQNIKTDLTVGACIFFDNKILLVFHTKLNKWLFPGGHIEPNETPDTAIVREVKEETGLDFIFSDFGMKKTEDVIRRLAIPFNANLHSVGDHNHYCMYYLGTVQTSEFLKNEESRDIRWFDRENIEELKNIPENVREMALFALKQAE